VDPAAKPQEELVGLEVARFVTPDSLVDVVAVFKGPSAERPGSGEEVAQGVVLQIEPVDPPGIRSGPLELTQPELADVEKMLEGIVLRPDAIAEGVAKSGGIVNRSEVKKGVEFLFLQRRDVVEGIGQRLERETKAVAERAGVQGFVLQVPHERAGRCGLDGIFEEKNDVEVRAGSQFGAAGSSHGGDGERLAVGYPCLRGPKCDRLEVDPRPLRHDRAPVVELGLEDAGVVRGEAVCDGFGFGGAAHPGIVGAAVGMGNQSRFRLKRTSGVLPRKADRRDGAMRKHDPPGG
jgi:hypothetical protein